VLNDAHSDREERRSGGQCGAIREVDEPESAFPSVERRQGKTLASAELRDGQTAVRLAADANSPERMELGMANFSGANGVICAI
jgi:hypothetical protein